jgi:Ca2+-binding EF-hand superfamily protein
MKKTFQYMVLATLLSSSTQAVFAQERGEMLERLFSRMDQNKDGVIEQSEAPAEFWTRMSSADANKDGKIDKTEAAEGMKAMGGRRVPAERGPDGVDRAKGDRKSADRPTERPGAENRQDLSAAEQRDGGDRVRQLLERFGKDGKVALADLPAPLRERLAKLDTNSDKVIDQSELKGPAVADLLRGAGDNGMMMLDRVRQMMQALDKDGDGKVAIADFPGDFKDRLAKLDKNSDGMLERSEMAELRNMLGDGKGPPAGAMLDRMQQMFKQFDKDGDGKVALADLPEMIRERLAKLDANNDGMVDKTELKELANSDKRVDGKSADGKPGEGRYGFGSDSTAPQAPKRPDSGKL